MLGNHSFGYYVFCDDLQCVIHKWLIWGGEEVERCEEEGDMGGGEEVGRYGEVRRWGDVGR